MSLAYWSVGDGEHGLMLRTLVRSARDAGVAEDFHVWSDVPVPGATCHEAGTFDKRLYLFKLKFMVEQVCKLPYDHLVFLDADSFFVRRPERILLNGNSPLHVTLESHCGNKANTRPDWWGCPLGRFEELMRGAGVMTRRVYNCNAGFWVVKREACRRVYDLCMSFSAHCMRQGFEFTEEPLLSYAMHMLCADTEPHTLRATSDTWASDWTGEFGGRLPDGRPFRFTDYFTGEGLMVNPAIVHAMRSKGALARPRSGYEREAGYEGTPLGRGFVPRGSRGDVEGPVKPPRGGLDGAVEGRQGRAT